MVEPEHNVFGLLDHIRERPGMYLRDGSSLKELETLLWGYYSGLSEHGIVEAVPMINRHFMTWLYRRTKWACNCGWAFAIDQRYPDRDKALAKFFELVHEYRKLKPVVLFSVRLAARHKPTGKQVRTGTNTLMAKPNRVDIVRYRPEALHFLRFHYKRRTVNGDLLMTSAGDFATTVRFAKEWVRDELQVEFGEWGRVT